MPSLYDLASAKRLPDEFAIIGVDHASQDTETWRKSLTETMQSFTTDATAEFYVPKLDDDAWSWVADRLTYQVGDFGKDETFAAVKQAIGDKNAIFYCAVAARFFGVVVDGLGKAGLLQQKDGVFRRVVIEKPFGSDLPSAQALNAQILKQADESQFFRIDHFLGKDTVQSIMAVRFGNGMFEPIWRREYVDHVEITAAETVGVEDRGRFYEPTGALRDMVPNHMFTLLSMVAMEPPSSYDAEAVRSEKARLMQAICPLQVGDAVRGQYGAGTEFGKPVPGYRQEAQRGGRQPDRDIRRAAASHRELALGRGAVLHLHRQAAVRAQDRDRHPLQAAAVSDVRRRADDAQRHAPADRPGGGDRRAVCGQDAGTGDDARPGREQHAVQGPFRREAERWLRDAVV